MTRLTREELAQSTLAGRKGMPPVVSTPTTGPQFPLVSLCKIVTAEGVAQAWRITLGRLDRTDDQAIAAPGDVGQSGPLYLGQQFQYDFWAEFNATVPPRRAFPIFGSGDPDNGAALQPAFVEIAWGMQDARANRLLANWPVQGGSIVLVGSYVEVWGAARCSNAGVPAISFGTFPMFQATITQHEGLDTASGAELSLTTSIVVQNTIVAAAMFPDGVAHVGAGLAVRNPATNTSFAPNGALRGSAVFGVGPFTGWNPTLRPLIAGRRPRLSIWVNANGLGPNVQVTPNAMMNAAGSPVPSNGDVAVAIDTSAAPQLTYALLEAAITAAAGGLLQVQAASPNPGHFIMDNGVGVFANVATYTPPLASNDAGNGNSSLAIAGTTPATQGAVLYVPDFARRVRVVLTTLVVAPVGAGSRIPNTGDPVCVCVFYNDRGAEVDEWFQGPAVPAVFHEIPAQAVLLGIYPVSTDPLLYDAMVHWRIAP